MESYFSTLKKAVASGVNMAVGTDAGSPQLPHPTLPYEVWLWNKEAGIEPLEVLRAATVGSARALGREEDIGLLKPGYRADFVLYKTNPLDDVLALHYPEAVYKAGEKVAGASALWSLSLTKKGGRS
jgi:imidazolonepropionase-like amidohydrolase